MLLALQRLEVRGVIGRNVLQPALAPRADLIAIVLDGSLREGPIHWLRVETKFRNGLGSGDLHIRAAVIHTKSQPETRV